MEFPYAGISVGVLLPYTGKMVNNLQLIPDFQERDLWTIQDRDSGILIRDSGGAMSAGISVGLAVGLIRPEKANYRPVGRRAQIRPKIFRLYKAPPALL